MTYTSLGCSVSTLICLTVAVWKHLWLQITGCPTASTVTTNISSCTIKRRHVGLSPVLILSSSADAQCREHTKESFEQLRLITHWERRSCALQEWKGSVSLRGSRAADRTVATPCEAQRTLPCRYIE